jgi:hypothetical protein
MAFKLYEEWIKLYEEKVPVSIDKNEIGRVDKNDSQTISQISKLVDSSDSKEEIISLLISQKNFDEKSARQIFELSVEHKSHQQLLDILKNPSKQLDINKISQTGNIIDLVMKSTQCTYEFCESVADYIPYTSVKIGRYEMFLRLFLKGGKSPARKGDVEVNGKEMEVKSTMTKKSGFRLRGQSGYGTGTQVKLAFLNGLKNYYGKGGPNHGGTSGIPNDIFSAYKSQNGQMWYKDKKNISWAEMASTDIVAMSLANKDEIVNLWSESLVELYRKGTSQQIKNMLLPAFNNDGSFDKDEIIYRLAAYEFKIYKESEKFDYFIVLNYKNEYIIFPPNISDEEIVKIIKDKFSVTAPSTLEKGTERDALTKLLLK